LALEGTDKVAERIAKQGLMYGYGDGKFHPNDTLTNKQALLVFCRLMAGGTALPTDEEELNTYMGNVLKKYSVSLPSDLVYSSKDWESVWRDILTGKTVFEKIGENKYSVTLIPGYFKIYLNDKGYFLFKKGMIPSQIEFYSPYTTVEKFSEEILNQPATKGFVMELMSIYDMSKNLEGYSEKEIAEKEDEVIKLLTVLLMEQTVNKVEKDWNSLDIDKYNYVSMSYGGAMQYGMLRGIIQPENKLEDMNRPIKRIEYATIIDRINQSNDLETLDSILTTFLTERKIDGFNVYLNK